jgi:hypothetical protein
MTFSSNTSVASGKFRIATNPKIAIILWPGIIGFTSPLYSFMFFAIISDPASPKPIANKAPIFIIVYSRIEVSKFFSYYF